MKPVKKPVKKETPTPKETPIVPEKVSIPEKETPKPVETVKEEPQKTVEKKSESVDALFDDDEEEVKIREPRKSRRRIRVYL